MITHFMKLIWNRRRSNSLLMLEIIISFMVLFAVFAMIIYNWSNYSQPLGFDHKNVWRLEFSWPPSEDDQTRETLRLIKDHLKTYPEIESFSLISNNLPYTANTSSYGLRSNGETDFNTAHRWLVEKAFFEVLRIPINNGRGFQESDRLSKQTPYVVNSSVQDDWYNGENPVGQPLKEYEEHEEPEDQIIGTIGNYRYQGEFMDRERGFFELFSLEDTSQYVLSSMLIRLRESTGIAFEERLNKDLQEMAKTWTISSNTLESRRKLYMETRLSLIVTLLGICGFLIINTALGLFGVLWNTISKRKSEIGLRRAMGSSAQQILLQFLGEMWAIALLALTVGIFFALQFPLFDVFDLQPGIYFMATLFAAAFILLLVTVCALYPSKQAAQIQPAVVLHED